jgi:hypothetical protein
MEKQNVPHCRNKWKNKIYHIVGINREVETNWTWYNPKEPVMLDYWGNNRPDNYMGMS